MRAVIQRVSSASVTVQDNIVGYIGMGLVVLLGVAEEDTHQEATLLANKTAHMRIFANQEGRFDRSLVDVQGQALVISQFTLLADTRKGRRPSFVAAAQPHIAAPLVDAYIVALRTIGIDVATGSFGAMMHVALVNDGPVTIILDSDTFKQACRQS